MLPSRYRDRYALFIVLSLLVHALVVTGLLWSPLFDEKAPSKKTTVEVKLKQKAKPASEKIEKQKSASKKAQEKEKAEAEAEAKKAEAKKAEPKKTEAKKAEPKKAEPKKAEPKKAEPKKAEPKKAEPKKAEPKKAEPKKAEPKKAEPKKAEPKKAEPKKAEPKKAEPKKVEPKKAEPKKTEPKKTKPQKIPELDEIPDVYKTDMQPIEEAPKNTKQEGRRLDQMMKKFGSMQVLDEREMRRTIISAAGYGRKFKNRSVRGDSAVKNLNIDERQEFNQFYQLAAETILKNYVAPKKDGRNYRGEISFLLDEDGYVENVTFKTRSGNAALDDAMLQAVLNTPRLQLPNDPNARYAMQVRPITLWYNQEDMVD